MLNVVSFNTETNYDKLTVEGTQYHGTTGPQGVVVSAGIQITWSSDGSETRAGFEICVADSGGSPGEDTTPVINEDHANTMTELYNAVGIWGQAESTTLGENVFKCSEGECISYGRIRMLAMTLDGEMKCLDDYAPRCVLDGENVRALLIVNGSTDSYIRTTIRAITITNANYDTQGAGLYASFSAHVTIELCVFSNCRSGVDADWDGGGAIGISDTGTTIDLYGTTFTSNSVVSGNGADLYNSKTHPGSITVRSTCPSPYNSNSPSRGKTSNIFGSPSNNYHSTTHAVLDYLKAAIWMCGGYQAHSFLILIAFTIVILDTTIQVAGARARHANLAVLENLAPPPHLLAAQIVQLANSAP